jgi:hypothetical protein
VQTEQTVLFLDIQLLVAVGAVILQVQLFTLTVPLVALVAARSITQGRLPVLVHRVRVTLVALVTTAVTSALCSALAVVVARVLLAAQRHLVQQEELALVVTAPLGLMA